MRRVRPPWAGHEVPGSIFCGPGAQHLFPALVRIGSRLGEAEPYGAVVVGEGDARYQQEEGDLGIEHERF